MDPQNQQPSSGPEPLFDPTNPGKPLYIQGAPTSTPFSTATEKPAEQNQVPQKIKKIVLTRLVIWSVIILVFASSSFIGRNRNAKTTNPPFQPSGSSPSGPSTLKAGNYTQSDGSIPFNDQSSTQPPAGHVTYQNADDERKADVTNLHNQLENYYQKHQQYPLLANMNDKAWRTANTPTLDTDWLKDPSSSLYTLAAVHGEGRYSYSPFTSNMTVCDNLNKVCAVYRVAAVLSDGSVYVKDNLYGN